MTPAESEEHLARRAQQGDQEAFLTLYNQYFPKVYNRVKSRVPVQYAEDVTQEVFIAVVRSLGHFEQRSQFNTWLYTIVNRQIANFYRRDSRHADAQNVSLDQVEYTLAASAYEAVEMDERAVIQQAFQRLPDHYQEIILQRFADGLTFLEIAQARKQSLEAIKSLYRRAIELLRTQIGEVQSER